MTRADLEIHAKIVRRALERHKQSGVAHPLVLAVLASLEQEYASAHEIFPVDNDA